VEGYEMNSKENKMIRKERWQIKGKFEDDKDK
jgi:hypothetical protein